MADEKVVSKVRCVCRACGEVFEVEKFVPGETKCPVCLITSEVRVEGEETSNRVGKVPKRKSVYFVCDRCDTRWRTKYGEKCPICGLPSEHKEVVFI